MNLNFSSRRLLVLALVSFFVLAMVGPYNTSAIQQTEAQLLSGANAAIGNAQNELVAAQTKRLDAERRLHELEEFSNFTQPDNSSLQKIGSLTRTVDRMFDPATEKKLQEQLTNAHRKLTAETTKLTDAKTALGTGTGTEKIEAAKTNIQAKVDAITALKPELEEAGTKLTTALAAIYGRVKDLATVADDRLKPFAQPPTEAPAILNLFAKLGDVPPLMQFQVDLVRSWRDLSAKLEKVADNHAAKAAEVESTLTKLRQSVEAVAQNINVPIRTLASYAETTEDQLFAKSEEFKRNPPDEERKALNSIQENRRLADALDKILRNAASVSNQAESANVAGFDKTKTTTEIETLTKNAMQLRRQGAAFQALLSGDRGLWVTEKIRLYYFTDIPRLIQTLNPEARLTGGDADARRRAEERLDKLRAAEDAQSEANGNVLSLKKRVGTVREELRQANAELNAARILAQSATRKHTELERRPEGSVPPERMARSQEDKTSRDQELTTAQERADRLNDQNNGLAAQLREAEAQLEIAQATFERASSATIRAAQVESTAFANARDNAPFWFAEGLATSTDPARRVDITSSTSGENAIFIRGRREDIVKVQDTVAKLDEPAPQARMTLWKIELNSDATQKGAEKFNEALVIVEKELADTRAKIADTLSLLLAAVSEEAEQAAIAMQTAQNQSGVTFDRKDCHERDLYAQYGFRAQPTLTDITGRYQRLRRYSLYSQQVRNELGIRFIDELGFDNPKQFGLKDPGSATTLNEALIILLLTDRFHRERIMHRFETALRAKFGPDSDFKRLHSMLELDLPTNAATELQTTRQQQELIYAIRGPLLRHLVGRIARLQNRVDEFRELERKRRAGLLNPSETTLHECLQRKLPLIFDTIHDEFPISPVDVMDGHVKLIEPGEGTIGLQPMENGRPIGPPNVYNLRPSPARVAAADGMLDVFTKAFEDDIDRAFVQPMLLNLRRKLMKTGIGFGVIQRTSVLATNRLVARVDPRATAELSVGQETNLIQGLQQIAQLTLDAKTGNIPGVLGRFGTMAGLDAGAEIFGITSGSAFQVTPIFDPTGQALRFRFDFVDTTLVREPRGTVNPRIPRIERHTVNTEVQLANLEIREVSRFESDSKIGIPTTYRGGLPILKDIPGLRPIPLIGWFIRRKGSNAIAQRSLIFAQTTMSPTIGDILDLFDTSLQRR
jgi:hypothetical protein